MQPWVANLLPIPITQLMIGTAILDTVIGICLLFNIYVWVVALIGFLHVSGVLIVTGITDVTVRDIAIAYCAFALMIETLPEFVTLRLPFLK